MSRNQPFCLLRRTLEDKAISALAGLAPHPSQSGPRDKPRRVRGGRKHVRVCIVAVMRKHIGLLNQICANPNFILA